MGGPDGVSFKSAVFGGPQLDPPLAEADVHVAPGQEQPVAPEPAPQPAPEQVQPLAPHAAFVAKLFAEAAKIVDADQQKSLFKTIGSEAKGLDRQSRKAINEACAAVKNSLAALDKLTGRQIAEYGQAGNENIKSTLWDALKAHMDLADLLMEASRGLKPNDKRVRAFQNQAVFLNKRVCTITKLIGELDALRKKTGTDGEALGRTHQTTHLGAIENRNSDAGGAFRKELEDITSAVNGMEVLTAIINGEEVSPEDLAAAKNHLKDLSGQLDKLAQTKPKDSKAQNLIATARDVVKRAGVRLAETDLAQMAKKAAGAVVKLITLPGAGDIVRLLGGEPGKPAAKFAFAVRSRYRKCDALADGLRKLAADAVRGKATTNALDEKLKELTDAIRNFEEVLDLGLDEESNLDKNLRIELACVRNSFGPNGAERRRIAEAIGHLRQLVGQKTKLDGHVLKSVLEDPEAFSAVVEARVRGIDPALIDFDLSTGNLKSAKKLGSGAFSSAYRCTFSREDGSEDVRVFKPDGDATRGLQRGVIACLGGMAENQQAINVNFMAHEVAEMIGAGHTVCKSSAGFVNGQFGFLIEEAPGIDSFAMKALVEAAEDKTKARKELKAIGESAIGEMKVSDYRKLPTEKKTPILAQMAQQLNQLQWADLIAGQLDRHGRNYNVGISRDGKVTIKGFDNDQCGAAEMIGIGKMRITDMAKFRKHLADKLKISKKLKTDAEADAAAGEAIESFAKEVEGFDAKNGGVVDVSKFKTAEQLNTFIHGTGLRSVAPPTYMDLGVYENIMRLTDGVKLENGLHVGGELETFRETLRVRGLTEVQVEAAVARLMEARDIGIKLKDDHMVFTLHELENAETLKAIANNDRQAELNRSVPEDDKNLMETSNGYGTNYFNRPEFLALLPKELKIV